MFMYIMVMKCLKLGILLDWKMDHVGAYDNEYIDSFSGDEK